MATFKPVFRARFGHREGPHLAKAFTETVASFRPSSRQPFPIPLDVEIHLPSLPKADESGGGPPIREKLQARHDRSRSLLSGWEDGQGAKIKAQRAPQLYAACWLEAFDQARIRALDDRVQRLVLSQAEINTCFQRAISTERVKRHGRPPSNAEQHWQQLTEIAAEWGLQITPEWWSKDTAKSLAQKEAA
jgi:hypothetical protein